MRDYVEAGAARQPNPGAVEAGTPAFNRLCPGYFWAFRAA
jgi:hypothetical protein